MKMKFKFKEKSLNLNISLIFIVIESFSDRRERLIKILFYFILFYFIYYLFYYIYILTKPSCVIFITNYFIIIEGYVNSEKYLRIV
jgi:uncharacterized membrane protein HdeD (DUF308 family)